MYDYTNSFIFQTDGSITGFSKSKTWSGTGSNAWANLSGTLTLEKGLWLISIYGKSTSSGTRVMQLVNVKTTWFDIPTTSNSSSYNEIASFPVYLANSVNTYVQQYNSSGSTVSVTVNAVRLL